MQATAPVLQTRDLHKTYESDGVSVHALMGVDVSIADGELVAVMGPSGCGKSTLLHLLGALDTPTRGEVLLDGVDLGGMSEDQRTLVRRTRIGFVFQFYNLVPVLTVAENVALPMVIDGKPSGDRVREVLDLLGIEELADKLPTRLSGGEQQRAAVARALVNRPAVLLADEPTGNLDYRTGRDVMTLLASLHDAGQTIVVVMRDPNVAAFAQRVLFMRDGTLVDEVVAGGPGETAPLVERLVALDPAP